MSYDGELKIVILGEGRVGKEEILLRYFNKIYDEGEISKINPSFYEKTWNYEGKKFLFRFWDTTGQEQFNAINNMYYQNADGALLVYDASIPETFERVKHYVNTLREVVGEDIVIVIAGNKFDLVKQTYFDENMVRVREYCEEEKCKHFYTSSKTGYNLDELFDSLITSVLEKVKSNNNNEKKKSGRKFEIKKKTGQKDKKGCY